jgi:hypothetical protein
LLSVRLSVRKYPSNKVFHDQTVCDLLKTRPVWTGFKIAVRQKLLTHYKKGKVLFDQSKDGLKVVIVKNIYSINNKFKFFIENKLEIEDAKYENMCVQKFDLKIVSQK